MSEFDEQPAGWVPLVGGGAWVPAGAGDPTPPSSPPGGGWWSPEASDPTPPNPPGGGWWNPGAASPASPPPPPPSPRRRRRAVPVVLTAAVVGLAGVIGLGIGHEAWPTTTTVSPAAQGSTTSPNGSSTSGGSGGGRAARAAHRAVRSESPTRLGALGQSPFGSGGSPFGSGGDSSGSGSGDGSGGSSSASSGSSGDTAAIAAKVSPALVDINSTFSYQSAQGAGTGIVLTSNGEILTNNHVINGATKISVTDIGNGKTYNANVVGYDATGDIAVLQLQGASGLQTAKIGDASKAAVGESVVAVGNAGGTGGTPSSAGGSITALNQSITAGDDLDGANEQLSGLIQVNADIQPGDSGGSLVNTAGEVIGMDTAASQGNSSTPPGPRASPFPSIRPSRWSDRSKPATARPQSTSGQPPSSACCSPPPMDRAAVAADSAAPAPAPRDPR